MTTLTSPAALRTLYDPVRERSAAKELQQLDVHATRFISLSPFVQNIIHTPQVGLLFMVPGVDEMLRDQVAHKVSPETAFETQAQMLERYRQTL